MCHMHAGMIDSYFLGITNNVYMWGNLSAYLVLDLHNPQLQ